MKNCIKKIISLFMCVVLMFSLVTVSFAATIYYYFGYRYTYINNELVSLYGVDEGTEYLFIPDTLNSRRLVDIRNNAFLNNKEITNLDFGGASNLERIGSFAFANCSELSGSFTIPENVVTIETAAFENCSSLESVVYYASVNNVPNQCFHGCSSLTDVTVNDNITAIEDYAFADCNSLSYIEIPASVEYISSVAFMNDSITLGVYTDSYAHQYASQMGINYILLDAPEPPTEPETEEPTVPETQEPTVIETESPTDEPMPTELVGFYLGDVDNNSLVETIDVTYMQRYLARLSIPTICDMQHGDIDSDGITSVIDITLIMRYLAQLETGYPIGEFIGQ